MNEAATYGAPALHGGVDLAEAAEAALTLADERGWNQVALRQVARRAGVPLAELYRHCPSKWRLLRAHARRVDALVAADQDPEDLQEPARDRLFEVLMRRFDVLQPHRAGIRSILECTLRDPAQAMGGAAQLRRSMRRMLEAAQLPTGGLQGELRLDGLCGLYLWALRTWVDDDTADLSRTMATLDGALRRIERPAAVLSGEARAGDVLRETLQESGLGRALERMLGAGPGPDAAAADGPVIDGEYREIHEPPRDPEAPGPAAAP